MDLRLLPKEIKDYLLTFLSTLTCLACKDEPGLLEVCLQTRVSIAAWANDMRAYSLRSFGR